MLRGLLKRQLYRSVGLTVLFCAILTLQLNASWESSRDGRYYQDGAKYMSQFDLNDSDTFFAVLVEDTNKAIDTVSDIEWFTDYEGEIPEGVVNPLDIASSGAMYMDYDMVIWRERMLDLPGKYTDSIRGDEYMLTSLADRLNYSRNLSMIITNHQEIAARGMRRGGVNAPLYKLAEAELNSIPLDFKVQDTAYTQNFLDYMEGDWCLIALIALIFFGSFSTLAQQRVTWQISVSKLGERKYVLMQIATTLIIALVVFMVYHIGVLLACCQWQPSQIAWELPIQCIAGDVFDSFEIILNLKVWEYILLLCGMKCLFGLLIAFGILLISLLCKNNTLAALGSVSVCGGLILLSDSEVLGNMLIGNASSLLEGLCWARFDDITISYSAMYFIILPILIIAVASLLALLAKPTMRRCSR